MTECFTSRLLNTYLIKKETLTVETIQNIFDNPGLSVTGRLALFEMKSTKPEVFKKLINRVEDYENRLDINTHTNAFDLLNPFLWEDLIKRKVVIIVGTPYVSGFKNLYQDLKVMEAKHKYNLLFGFSYVTKSVRNFT